MCKYCEKGKYIEERAGDNIFLEIYGKHLRVIGRVLGIPLGRDIIIEYCPMCRKEAGRVKTETTRKLEKLLEYHFNNRNEFYVFECTLGWCGSEIVDCVMYNCDRQIYCYEIKQSVQDFHSKNKLSFFGNKNYFVMPYSLYEKVKKEIPIEIGVYVAIEKMEEKKRETTDI